jgi:hypothetical protein
MSLGSPARIVVAVAAALACLAPPAVSAAPVPGPVKLTLINGWRTAPAAAKPSISLYNGIVHLKGAIHTSHGNNLNQPFVIPTAFRPASTVYVAIAICSARNGRLIIYPDGTVNVDAAADFSDARCLTSLDGATYAIDSNDYRTFNLTGGWTAYGNGTAVPAARGVGHMVRLEGALTGGTNGAAFVMPGVFRPHAKVFIPLDLYDDANGRLVISPDGSVDIEAENGFSNAQSFTSLDGAFYAIDTAEFAPLALENGWTNTASSFGTAPAGVRVDHGVVEFQGAIATTGTDMQPFILPAGTRPEKLVYIPVDLCDAVSGRLQIDPDGTVTVQAENDDTESAACFTSLEGASFHL